MRSAVRKTDVEWKSVWMKRSIDVMKKTIVGSFIIVALTGCVGLGDTTISRSGDNTGLKSWDVSQTFKWGRK